MTSTRINDSMNSRSSSILQVKETASGDVDDIDDGGDDFTELEMDEERSTRKKLRLLMKLIPTGSE